MADIVNFTYYNPPMMHFHGRKTSGKYFGEIYFVEIRNK